MATKTFSVYVFNKRLYLERSSLILGIESEFDQLQANLSLSDGQDEAIKVTARLNELANLHKDPSTLKRELKIEV